MSLGRKENGRENLDVSFTARNTRSPRTTFDYISWENLRDNLNSRYLHPYRKARLLLILELSRMVIEYERLNAGSPNMLQMTITVGLALSRSAPEVTLLNTYKLPNR